MRIMFVTPWYPDEERPNSGIFIRAQALALAQRNEVLVVAVKVNYAKRAFHRYHNTTTTSANLVEQRLEIFQSLPLYNQLNYLLIAYKFATREANKFNPDVIHASIGYPGAVLGWLLSRKIKVPFVFTEHTRPVNNFRSLWHKMSTRAAVQKAAVVMAVSQRLAADIQKEYASVATVIPNIVDVEKYTNVRPSNAEVWQWGFIGGMNTNVKGLDLLLDAVSKIKQPFHLHICGAGTLLESYKAQASQLGISSKCTFYGFIKPAQMPTFFQKIHALICSSRYETFNTSLVEAMACGMPVVSTRCGGPEDFVTEENGILCDKENVNALCAALESMLVEFSKFNDAKIKRIATAFSAESIVPKLEKVYLSVLNNKQSI
jgi:L-malate glycosyltransferase